MTMAASVVLENLPKDATRALETAGELGIAKGNVDPVHPIPSHLSTKHPEIHPIKISYIHVLFP
jgi:hypothetical protein